MSEFEKILNQPFARDIKELGLEPKSPLDYRLRQNIEYLEGGWHCAGLRLNGYDLSFHAFARFIEPIARELIKNPISIDEYTKRRGQAFKMLSSIASKDIAGKQGRGKLTFLTQHEMLSAALISTGYLSLNEAQASAGPDWNGFESSAQLNSEVKRLSGNTEASTMVPIITVDELIRKVRTLTSRRIISAVFIGTFDLDHEGQKETASLGRDCLGVDGTEFVLVTDDKTSELQKGKTPVRNLDRRVLNMAHVRGPNYICPIVVPDSVTTLDSAKAFYSDLLGQVQPLIRIIGSHSNVGDNWWRIYEEQCRKNDILMIYNESHTSTSSTLDRQALANSL